MLSRHPPWLRKKAPDPSVLSKMKTLMEGLSLHTVCESAHCPNQGECFSRGTATFLILGDVCTRNCRFCAIKKGRPSPLDPNEPLNVAEAVNKLGLKHAVVTSVTRDDLPDGGARHFVNTIDAIRQINPQVTIEVLIPDFQGSYEALKAVVASSPEVINHNVDTIPRLFPEVRPKKSDYLRSVKLLQMVKAIDSKMVTKSGLMLGLGETHDEVVAVMEALRAVECDCLTISQYLPPSPAHYPLDRYITPEEFEQYRKRGEEMGFSFVASGPFVRSSYRAAEAYSKVMHRQGI